MENTDSVKLIDGYGLVPALNRNDQTAKIFIWIISIIVFSAVALLSKIKLDINLGFNPHLFARANAVINSIVVVLLLMALAAVKQKKYRLHKRLMLAAIVFSIFFLVSYICHHLFSGETRYGDLNHDGLVSSLEKSSAGNLRIVYYFILGTHIPLAGIILPFILFTAYRSLSGDYKKHIKLARITFPIWLYVAITGVVIYFMISPYYN